MGAEKKSKHLCAFSSKMELYNSRGTEGHYSSHTHTILEWEHLPRDESHHNSEAPCGGHLVSAGFQTFVLYWPLYKRSIVLCSHLGFTYRAERHWLHWLCFHSCNSQNLCLSLHNALKSCHNLLLFLRLFVLVSCLIRHASRQGHRDRKERKKKGAYFSGVNE